MPKNPAGSRSPWSKMECIHSPSLILCSEIQIKKWSRAKKEALIAGDFVKLKNLSHSTRS
jgi:predicted GIY-YIG superfamily endonuclease